MIFCMPKLVIYFFASVLHVKCDRPVICSLALLLDIFYVFFCFQLCNHTLLAYSKYGLTRAVDTKVNVVQCNPCFP